METELTLETLEEFDLVPPCEHPKHAEHHESPTTYFIEVSRDCCEHTHSQLYICKFVWEEAGRVGILCKKCKDWSPRGDRWEILAEV